MQLSTKNSWIDIHCTLKKTFNQNYASTNCLRYKSDKKLALKKTSFMALMYYPHYVYDCAKKSVLLS